MLSIHDLQLANDMSVLIGLFAPRALLKGQLTGNINNAQFSVANSIARFEYDSGDWQKSLPSDSMAISSLRTQKLDDFVLDFPTPMVADVAICRDPQITQFLPTVYLHSDRYQGNHQTWHYSLDVAKIPWDKLIPQTGHCQIRHSRGEGRRWSDWRHRECN